MLASNTPVVLVHPKAPWNDVPEAIMLLMAADTYRSKLV
jgi:hypothetical protein